jgi:hypothetical protein
MATPAPKIAVRAIRLGGAPASLVRPHFGRPTEPFRDAAEAWFWTMGALAARREGARSTANQGLIGRPCEPDDVLKCLDQLYRRRRIDLLHVRIMRLWGERRMAPNPAYASERCDARIWREALERLEWPLRVKGIVG